jgi:hypothetical protein
VYKTFVPNQRSEDQKLIAFAAHLDFISALDDARGIMREDRSTFIRRAVVAELRKSGVRAKDEWISGPDRAGKGGPGRHSTRSAVSSHTLKERAAPHSKVDKAASDLLKRNKPRDNK